MHLHERQCIYSFLHHIRAYRGAREMNPDIVHIYMIFGVDQMGCAF
jgi:hypothetical protein